MNRFFQSLTCFALFATAGAAQAEQRNPAPSLSAHIDQQGYVTVTTSHLGASNGVMLLLGAFDDTMASLGKGLPSILVNSAIVAFTFHGGDALSVTAGYPPLPVMLQAVEASFAPFRVHASLVLQIGALTDSDLPPAAPATK